MVMRSLGYLAKHGGGITHSREVVGEAEEPTLFGKHLSQGVGRKHWDLLRTSNIIRFREINLRKMSGVGYRRRRKRV